ncbi:MAG TPA: histidinol dehydrogenase [Terriglobales bacterium]|nr:histidinol dehydrogenase [Terriglobales bacterium]
MKKITLEDDLSPLLPLVASAAGIPEDIAASARKLIDEVRLEGDAALLRQAVRFDKAPPDMGLVETVEMPQDLPAGLIAAMERAIANIKAFHSRQLPRDFTAGPLTARWLPVQCAAVYVPGGRAAYPSTVLMNCVPALIAGVERLYILSPAGPSGRVSPYVRAAAALLGVKEVYRAGGAGAVAAAAYGTATIPRADKIVGPGNAYVAAAKKELMGVIGIDMLAGPSEVLVIADETASPVFAAADLLSQAEHDPMARAILVTTSPAMGEAVEAELERQTAGAPREAVIRESLLSGGAVVVAKDLPQAAAAANLIAPEHLELLTKEDITPLIKNAGSVFVGPWSPEPIGDYVAGTNHVLPTAGSARFSSPLGVLDFMRCTQIIRYSKDDFAQNAAAAAVIADAEGLYAHKFSIEVRCDG